MFVQSSSIFSRAWPCDWWPSLLVSYSHSAPMLRCFVSFEVPHDSHVVLNVVMPHCASDLISLNTLGDVQSKFSLKSSFQTLSSLFEVFQEGSCWPPGFVELSRMACALFQWLSRWPRLFEIAGHTMERASQAPNSVNAGFRAMLLKRIFEQILEIGS